MLPDYRVQQREHLLDIVRALTEQLDLQTVLRRVLEASATMLAGEVGVIALRDDHDVLRITAGYGVEAQQIPVFDDLLGDVISGQFDPQRMNLRTKQIAKRLDVPLKQVIALPLRIANEPPMGLILVFRAFSGRATENDRQVLQSFADQAAIAVQNARLYAAAEGEKQRLSTLLDNSADGIMILDADLNITRFNRALSQMTGWRAEDTIGRQYDDIIRWERTKTDADLQRALDNDWEPNSTLYVEGELERLDGLTTSVGITYALLKKEDGSALNIIANVRDITNFRRAEEMKNTFISIISHELKTPVSLIKGYAGTLRREDAKWDQRHYQEALAVIEEEADRLTELIENLLAASKLQAQGMRLNMADIDLVRLIERAVERYQTQTTIHTIETSVQDNFPILQGDETRLRQVLDNLLSNAVKYSPKGGKIMVNAEYDAEWVRVSVKDSGIGLRQDQLDKVFDRFYRVDDKLTSETQGTGLGLYLVRAVVEAHGGRIWAESHVNEGATFIVALPNIE